MTTHYSDKKKTEAVVTYLAVGKMPLVSAVVDVPIPTLKQWRLQPWWKEMEEEIRREDEYELDTKLSKIIDRTLDAVSERIEGGEFKLVNGKVLRVPVALRDAHRVAVDLIDKRNLIRGKPTSRVEKTEQIDTMQRLATQFAEWAIQHMKREERVVNAIPEPAPAALHVQPETSNGQTMGKGNTQEQTSPPIGT